MLLHEIIEKIEDGEFLPYEEIWRYKKSLYRYFDGQAYSRYNELILAVYPISNACQLATITTESEFSEIVESFIDRQMDPGDGEEDREYLREVIAFASIPMGKLVGDM